MDITSSLAVIAFAALIHASFQLSVSMLMILSGHSIVARHSQAKLMRLTSSFLVGTGVMTLLIICSSTLFALNIFGTTVPPIIWSAACGLLVGIAISIWLFYYRREPGTTLWIPRSMANYLHNRAKTTKLSAEAFNLGLGSVIGELLFIVAPISIATLALIQLPATWQLLGIIIYTIISLLPLAAVWVLIGSGHKISEIQKWRENNKYFLQFAAGAGLIILSGFVYVSQVITGYIGGI